MATIYLVRHGQASFGTDDYDRLSPIGQRQADVLGRHFDDVGVRFDSIYCGDLRRQKETAQRVAAGQSRELPLNVDARFNEIDNDGQIRHLLPEVRNRRPEIDALVARGLNTSSDYQKVIEAVFNFWISADGDHADIQSWRDFSGNVRSALSELVENEGPGRTVGVFSSGGTIATMVAQVLNIDPGLTYKFYEPMINCSITEMFYSRERISLSRFNDCSYLHDLGARNPEDLVTYR